MSRKKSWSDCEKTEFWRKWGKNDTEKVAIRLWKKGFWKMREKWYGKMRDPIVKNRLLKKWEKNDTEKVAIRLLKNRLLKKINPFLKNTWGALIDKKQGFRKTIGGSICWKKTPNFRFASTKRKFGGSYWGTPPTGARKVSENVQIWSLLKWARGPDYFSKFGSGGEGGSTYKTFVFWMK